MKYCEGCCFLYEEDRCPLCGRRTGRAPKDNDPCFLIEKGQIESDMLSDVLRQNGIPSMLRGRAGAGLAMYTGLMLESFRVFVPYGLLEQAREVAEALFGGEILPDSETNDTDPEESEES